jgi:hypothetical protein
LSFLRNWLIGEDEGDSFQTNLELLRTWDESVTDDLITLLENDSNNGDFARWFKPAFISAYHWIWHGVRSFVVTLLDEKRLITWKVSNSN